MLVAAGDQYGVYLRVFEDLRVIRARVGRAEAQSGALASRAARREDRAQIHARKLFDIRQMLPLGEIARAREREFDRGLGPRFRSRSDLAYGCEGRYGIRLGGRGITEKHRQ